MTTPAPRILLLSQYFHPELIGSAFYASDLARWLAARGAAVEVVCDRPFYPERRIAPGYESGAHDDERWEGVAVGRVATVAPSGPGAVARLKNELNYLARTAARLACGRTRRAPIVVSISPSIFAVVAGAMARARAGRLVAVVHDIQSGLAGNLGMVGSSAIAAALRRLETFALNRADAVVALTDAMRDTLVAQGVRRPIEVIPLWVDVDRIRPLPRPPGAPTSVQYSGNLGRKQGWSQVIAMAAALQTRRPDAVLTIRGAGSEAAAIEREIAARGLRNVVRAPFAALDALAESLAEGDVHLVPQDPEGAAFAAPSKIYPILAAGRPFVCTASPGSPLAAIAAESGAGLCAPPNAPDAFTDAVVRLLDDAATRGEMGLRGRAYAVERAARDRVLQRYLALMNGTSAGPQASASSSCGAIQR